MQVVNEMRNYFNKLVRDTKNPGIKYFSNIELGESFNNPHLHIQLFFNDEKQIRKIYNKVISKFGLFSDFCHMVVSGTECEIFNYVVKDYSKNMSSEEILQLDDAKRMYRGVLGKNLRFSSHSKGEHTKLIYKRLYTKGIKRENVDWLLNNCVIDTMGNIVDNRVILMVLRVLVQILNKSKIKANYSHSVHFMSIVLAFMFLYWVYGFL